jgi:UPF0716 protein FxsA
MRWLIVVAAFILVPIAELWAILTVGHAIGVGPTILLLLADSVLGAMLLRSQGRSAWRRFVAALQASRLPNREIADGLLIMLGGALLLTPGFLTDIVGALFLLPPTRAILRRVLERGVARRLTTVPRGDAGRGFGWRVRTYEGSGAGRWRAGSDGGRPFDVEGTARERPGGPPPARPHLER